ncbi:MAG: leucine-rich repeat protein [Spirochaetaceae bacterium]|nr:leucine-rich repeat protein [Spirochaetaceae bacterium]
MKSIKFFVVLLMVVTLFAFIGCPDPVNVQTPVTPEEPAGGGTPANSVTSVNYTVKHMKQDVSGDGYTEDTSSRQTLTGAPGATTAAQAKSYTGFTAQAFSQATIAADGSTVVTINYNRNVHSVSYSATTSGVTAPAPASYRFGAQITVEFPAGISAWSYGGTTYTATNNTFSMPDSNVVLAEIYTVSSNNVAETLSALGSNNADTPYTLIVSNSTDLAAITEAISNSDIYVTLSLEDCEGLTSLPANAFAGCENLTSIVIPETVTSVGSDIFSGCTNLESVSFAGEVDSAVVTSIITALPSDTVIEAADTTALDSIIEGIDNANSNVSLSLENCTGLTSLEDGLFQNCDNLASITLPDTLESIGNNAFEDCTGLSSITLPDNLESIGDNAFEGCTGLSSITLPDSLESIGSNAFEGCTGLSSIAIPETVTSVGTGVFTGCSNLDTVSFAGNVDSDVVTDIIASLPSGAVIEAADTTALTSVVQGINSASSNVSLSLENCTGLTSLSDNAFQGCDNLTSITLPASVTSISNTAFSGCSDLVSINVPAGNSDYSSANGVLLNNNGTTLICCPEGKTSVSVPSTVTSIGNNAFNGCTGLESIVIPDSVTSVGTGVFNGCTNIESVTLPGTLNQTSIQNALSSLPTNNAVSSYDIEVTNITTDDQISSLKTALSNSGKYVDLSLENCTGLTSLPNNAFKNCDKLTSISLPSSVTSIRYSAFSGCSALRSISIPSSVTSIGENAFSDCRALQSITIPSSVTSIGNDAFRGCSKLQSITLPDSVTLIGYGAFSYCRALQSINVSSDNNYFSSVDGVLFNKNRTTLIGCPGGKTSITIPESVTSIGDSAFYGCSKLQSITLPDSVTSIGNDAFFVCEALQSITLPDSVTSIGSYAFSGCSKLQSITLPDSVTLIGYGAFYNCIALQSITLPDSVTSIGPNAFYNCIALQSITIPESVTSIGYGAFSWCRALQSITLPDSVTSIEYCAFYNCEALQSITIPESVTSIGDSAFYGCSKLQSITLPDSVTSIGENAFYVCWALQSITIPSSVTSIGFGAFYSCSKLQTITFQGNKAQWNRITKANYWNFCCPATMQVVCTDGTVTS